MENHHVNKIPDYLETLQRERSMKHGHVANVTGRVKTPKKMGADLYPAPRREAQYPLNKPDYPQYSPGGNNITAKRHSLDAVRV